MRMKTTLSFKRAGRCARWLPYFASAGICLLAGACLQNLRAAALEKGGETRKLQLNLVIGCNRSNLKEDDLGSSFRGLIDEPMMWNRALSTNEVEFLYQSQQ